LGMICLLYEDQRTDVASKWLILVALSSAAYGVCRSRARLVTLW
jgi:hypothetical protein